MVFEDVLYNDTPVFIEHDIEDEGQTIDIPEIGTKATANGKKEVQGGGTIAIEVTTHTDLDDDDQTVKITPPGAPPKTGDRFPVIPVAAALIISVGCIVYIIRRKRER